MFQSNGLGEIMKIQLKSLFVGVVVNEGSLNEYAKTKRIMRYQAGYSFETLSKIDSTINNIKSQFPGYYQDLRREFMHKLSNARPYTFFNLCDEYIKQFIDMNFISEKELILLRDRYMHGKFTN